MKLLLNKWFLFYIPRRLPIGMTAFNSWVDNIIESSGLPNNASTKRLAASFIMQLPPSIYYLSTHHVAKQMVRAAAYQVANEVIKYHGEKADTNRGPSLVVPEVKTDGL